MGTVHYLPTPQNRNHQERRLSELQFRTAVLGSRLGSYTDATASLMKARDELDKWYGFFGPVLRFLNPTQHMLAVEKLARAEHKQREAYRDFVKARNKLHE